jgi:hypothetical protein
MVVIDDEHLEAQIEAESERRGQKTKAATAKTLLTERLTELRVLREHKPDDRRPDASAA